MNDLQVIHEAEGNFMFILNEWAKLDGKRQDGEISYLEQVEAFNPIMGLMGLGFISALATLPDDEVKEIMNHVEKCENAFKELM